MNEKVKIEIDGIEYKSVAIVARKFGLNTKTVQERLRSGWNLQEALGLIMRPQSKPARRVSIIVKTHEGIEKFSSIKDAALKYGIEPKIVRARLTTHHWSIEQALGIVPPNKKKAHNRKPVNFILNGIKHSYDSVTAAANSLSISEYTVFNRINSLGWTIEQALELETPPEHTKKCYGYIYLITNKINGKKYVGQTMRTIDDRWKGHIISAQKIEMLNINSLSLSKAIREFGADSFSLSQIDIASTYEELNKLERYWIKNLDSNAPNGYNLNRGGSGVTKGQPITVGDVNYHSMSDAAREYNFDERLILDRIRRGWTIGQALELESPPDSHKFSGKIIKIKIQNEEITFNSIGELSRYFNLSTALVMQRIVKLHWTPEQAVGLANPKKWVHPSHAISIMINGKKENFKSKNEIAIKYGFKRWATIEKRISRNWTIDQALGIMPPPGNKFESKRIEVAINGVKIKYNSQCEAANAHGISFKKVSARVKYGWTYEEALEIVPRIRN